jgi:membrane protease YdiL (CAAX protease family)
LSPPRPLSTIARWATAAEVVLVYTAILLYIWRWQYTFPRFWVVLVTALVASHLLHRDTPRTLGLWRDGLMESARLILPVAAGIFVPTVVLGFACGALTLIPPTRFTLVVLLVYGAWCTIQQYLLQSYFNHRLLSITPNRHFSSLLAALMFGAAHLPNPVLTVVTTLGGILLAEVFARHRNIWPLALAHATGGFLVAALCPPWLIHNMRVGPGYFLYGLR